MDDPFASKLGGTLTKFEWAFKATALGYKLIWEVVNELYTQKMKERNIDNLLKLSLTSLLAFSLTKSWMTRQTRPLNRLSFWKQSLITQGFSTFCFGVLLRFLLWILCTTKHFKVHKADIV